MKDHLGSASVVTDTTSPNPQTVGEQRYYPYGEPRLTPGITSTDKLFTGQRDTGLGIYHYGARFYSPGTGRFLSPDTIVPGAANPQAWNRYSYVLGNPLKYTDPTGHMQVCERGDEGIEGKLHSSRCGSGANLQQIAIAFDKKHGGKGYSDYYAKMHGVKTDLDLYLKNIKIEYEKETDTMRDKRTSRIENQLIASVNSARLTGQLLHYALRQDGWKSDAEFPKILGGGYIIDNSSGTAGGDTVPGSGEFSSFSISDIVKYYTRTPSLHYGPPGR